MGDSEDRAFVYSVSGDVNGIAEKELDVRGVRGNAILITHTRGRIHNNYLDGMFGSKGRRGRRQVKEVRLEFDQECYSFSDEESTCPDY